RKDPSAGSRMTDYILNHAHHDNRFPIARQIVDHLTNDDLKQLASTPTGKTLLVFMRNELSLPYGMKSPGETRVRDALAFQGRIDAAHRALERTPDFGTLPKATRDALLNAAGQHVGDKAFQAQLQELVGNAEFRKLGDKGAAVAKNLASFANTTS